MSHSDPLQLLIGQSAAIEQVRQQIRRLARFPVPVLLLGETGTGKEVGASALSALSGRGPCRAVNCAALAENLVESELFGHVRGAFTGAVQAHAGVIAEAHRGNLFLDELGEIPLPVQAKLLRTLESGEYRPVGSTETRTSEFRTLAATNQDPEQLVVSGRLRADLLYRLGHARVWLPPLRQRLEDIPLLAQEFLRRHAQRHGTGAVGLEAPARTLLMEQAWPGNVRQLLHVVETAVAMAGEARLISADHFREVLTPPSAGHPFVEGIVSLAEVRRRAEQHAIWRALRITDGSRARAAQLLGISEATLYRKLAPQPQPYPA